MLVLAENLTAGDICGDGLEVERVVRCAGYVSVWFTDGSDERLPYGVEIDVISCVDRCA